MVHQKIRRNSLPILVFILIFILLIIFTPNEKSLGSIIKYVYIHVALTWCGIIGFISLIGLLVVKWVAGTFPVSFSDIKQIGVVSTIAYLAGFCISLYAALLAWGSIYWQEPSLHLSTNILLISVFVLFINYIFDDNKYTSVMLLIPGLYYISSRLNLTRVLHPKDPIGTSDSIAIKTSFFLFFIYFIGLFGYLIFSLIKKPKDT